MSDEALPQGQPLPVSAAASAAVSPAVPPGFRPLTVGGAFIQFNGPLYLFQDGPLVKLGFRVEDRHCNPMHICHGGMLASFCDMLIPVSVHRKCPEVGRRFLPTVSLQLDYMAPAPLGAWVEGEAEVLKLTRTMLFAQGLVRVDGEVAVRCSGVFKLGARFGDGAPTSSR